MKKIITLSVLLLLSVCVNAQLFKADTEVRTGKLKNGLTYFIRHNEEPKNLAYFYIAQKVGAIQEEPNQRGLAHFLEHMCFNGTKHFPRLGLRTYLEKIGVKFGADLNAYTAIDETVYNIDNVPVKVTGAIDSCLWILHDWSNDLTLDPKEIDDERGVINEEWRSRNSASQRMNEAMMPILMAGSKYADSMPIGSMDIIKNFKPQELRNYYEKWYRPDLQGIVIVGDIDVNEIEAKIKKIFSDIPAPSKDAAQRVYYKIPENKDVLYFSGRDKEIGSSNITMYFRHPSTPRDEKNSKQYMINSLFSSFIYNMYHDHTRDIAQKPNSPFALAFIRDGGFFLAGKDNAAVTAIVGCHSTKNGITQGLEAMLVELFRVRQHGFTQSEFDRYCKDMLMSFDNLLKEKNKRRSVKFVNEYVRHFIDNQPIPNLEDEISFWKQEIPKLKVEDLNKYFNSLFDDNEHNMAISITAPQNDSIVIPTKDEVMALYYKIKNTNQTPYVDYVNDLPFLPKEPKAGKVVSRKKTADGYETLKLSNGVTVKIKKTDLKQDEILVQAMGKGGFSLIPAEMYKYNTLINMMTSVSGWGNYNLSDMGKKFVGINASINSGITDNYQSIAGSCSPKDIKSELEMLHAAFLYPFKDSDAFTSLCQRLKKTIEENIDKPGTIYGDSLNKTIYGNTLYSDKMDPKDYKDVDYDKLLSIYKERFSDASNFTVTFVGNIDIDATIPYIEKYIASLPSTYKKEESKPIKLIKRGSRSCVFEKEQETPKSTICIEYVTPNKYSLKNTIISSILGQVLTLRYTKTIREEAGAAYSVGAGCVTDYYPEERTRIIVRFPTSPDKSELAISLVDKGIKEIVDNGPSTEDVEKAKEYLLKLSQSNRGANQYWQYVMSYEWNHGTTYDDKYDEIVKSITNVDIKKMASLINSGTRIMVVMNSPKDKK